MPTLKKIDPTDPIFMEEAVQEAIRGVDKSDGGPFGAVIVKDGQIIAKGHNRVLISHDPTAHAEVTAIRAAADVLKKFDLSGCVLYTSCFPCPMCMGAALWARLDAVYYGATMDDAASVGFSDADFWKFLKDPKSNENVTLEHVQVNDLIRPFRAWDEKKDKIPY